MPIYEFQCLKCRDQFEEIILSSSETESVQCPKCGCAKVTKLLSTGNIRADGIPKGSGGFKGAGAACKPGG
ncbi:MAG: FmdB family zinc ribbon protein [bacterium]